MGFRIDRLAVTLLSACAIYLFFLNAFDSIPIAAISAFAAMAILKKLTRKLPIDAIGRKRKRLAEARAELEELSVISEEDASRRIHRILLNAYPDKLENTAIIPVIRHPGGRKFTADELVALWHSVSGHSRTIIAVTASCDESALALAPRLSSPSVSLIDAPGLIRLIAECGPSPAHILNPPPRSSIFAAIPRAAGRAKTGKCFFTGIIMFALFVMTGVAAYLVGAVLLIFIACVSLRKRRLSRELF